MWSWKNLGDAIDVLVGNATTANQAPTADALPDVTTTREFTGVGSLLALATMDADTIITTSETEDFSVTVTGRKSLLDKLVVDNRSGLSITAERPNANFSVVINQPSVFSIFKSIKAGSELLKQLKLDPEAYRLKIVATVPQGTNLRLKDYSGSIALNGVLGKVSGNVSYSTRLTLDTIAGLDLKSDSELGLDVDSLTGNASIETSYNGRVVIRKGFIDKLSVVSGSELQLTVGAPCTTATLRGAYSCQYKLGTVSKSLRVNTGSEAELQFAANDMDDVDITTSYDTKILSSGTIRRVRLKTGSQAKIELGAVTELLTGSCDYNCTIITTNGEGTAEVDLTMGSEATIHLIGTTARGEIVANYSPRLRVGALGEQVRTRLGSDASIKTGYFAR